MARRKRFKFKLKLTRKQKKKLRLLVILAICTGVGGLFLSLFLHLPEAPSPSPSVTLKPSTPAKTRQKPPTASRTRQGPKIVFVIDDIGNHNRYYSQLKALKSDVTYAILPLLPYSRYYGDLSRTTGAEVILHLPLDTTQDKIPGRGLIVDTMSTPDILSLLSRDLASVPHHVGVNNHMGSRGTANRKMMTIILTELKRRGLFFLDSYTTPASVVPSVGRSIGIPVLTRGVFLDNDDSKPAIRSQVKELRKVARAEGSAIAIGHYRKNTLEVLAQEIPRLKKEGFEIITLKQMLKIQRN